MSGKRGAPSKFTPETSEKILEAIRKGNYREVAAKYAGITFWTFNHWMKKGKAGEEGYAEFSQAVLDAETSAEINAIARVIASPDMKDLRWWLERKFRDRWGPDKDIIRDIIKRIGALEEGRVDGSKAPGSKA
jgi:hypothetical protein